MVLINFLEALIAILLNWTPKKSEQTRFNFFNLAFLGVISP